MPNEIPQYKFSFTAVSLRTRDLVSIADNNGLVTKDLHIQIGNGKISTGQRIARELLKRYNVLTDEQKDLLKNGSYKIQKEISFYAICKYYGFIRDFIIEVVRENYLVYQLQITDGDYISFFRRKADIFPKMTQLTEITQKKIKQVTFNILAQADIIDGIKSRKIIPQLLEIESQKAILSDNPEFLKVFLYSDIDLNQLKEIHA